MDPLYISYIFSAGLAVISYLLKQSYSDLRKANEDLKNQNLSLWKEINIIKDKYFKKEDFSAFKQELWNRLDRFEDDVKARIEELRK